MPSLGVDKMKHNIIILSMMFLIVIGITQAQVGWWDATYLSCRDVTVTNPQQIIRVNINYTDFDKANNTNGLYASIRVVNGSCSTSKKVELPYFVETNYNTSLTQLYSIFINSSYSTELAIYYNNPTSATTSNISSVAFCYDDFNRPDSGTVGNGQCGGWTETEGGGGTHIISGQKLKVTQSNSAVNKASLDIGAAGANRLNYTYITNVYYNQVSQNGDARISLSTVTPAYRLLIYKGYSLGNITILGAVSKDLTPVVANIPIKMTVDVISNTSYNAYINNELRQNGTTAGTGALRYIISETPNGDSNAPMAYYDYIGLLEWSGINSVISLSTEQTYTPFIGNQTPTPLNFGVISLSNSSMTLSWTAQGDKTLIYRNGTNVENTTLNSYIDTGLIYSTSYSHYIKHYSTNYTTNLSNASSIIINTTLELFPPTLSFISQVPPTFNTTSLVEIPLNITYNITSNSGSSINNSKVFLNYTIIGGKIIYNKTLQPYPSAEIYDYLVGSRYSWKIDVNEIYSGTSILNVELIENTTHTAISLNDVSSAIKGTIYNTTTVNITRFIEIMCNNTASNSGQSIEVYLANTSYTTGSFLSSSNVQLIYTVPDGNLYNHCHTANNDTSKKSCHHVVPVPYTTTIGRTDTMQVIVRGRNGANKIQCWAIPVVSGETSTTLNTGGLWTASATSTWDYHEHLFTDNETLSYYTYAKDTSSYELSNSSTKQVVGIGYGYLPPTNMFTTSPIATIYNNTILINHSVPQSRIAINTYKYEYQNMDTLAGYSTIVANNYPTTTYTWNTTALTAGNYSVRFTAVDSEGGSSIADTPTFEIIHWMPNYINETYIQNTNLTASTAFPLLDYRVGTVIKITNQECINVGNCKITKIGMRNGETATYGGVYNYTTTDVVPIQRVKMVANYTNTSLSVDVYYNQEYIIAIDNNGNTFNHYQSAATYPITDTELQFISAADTSNWAGTTWVNSGDVTWSVNQVTLQVYYLEPSPYITIQTNMTSGINSTDNPFNVWYKTTALYGASEINNCSIYLNNTYYSATTDQNTSTYHAFAVDTTAWQQGMNFNVTCFNSNNATIKDSFTTYAYIDTVPPAMTLEFSRGNNSLIYRYLDSVDTLVTAIDTNLFAINLTVKNISGKVLNNTFVTNLSGIGSYSLNYSGARAINPANDNRYTNGQYYIEATAWDSHTANIIKDYKQDKLVDGISFENKIKITSLDFDKKAKDMIKATKKTDRYTFEMVFTKENPTLFIECPDLVYVPSKYKGHFVCFEDKKWIDFEDIYSNVDKLDIKRVDKNKYSVTIYQKNILERVFAFNSIGDLNTVTSLIYFNVTDGFTFYAKDHYTNLSVDGFTVVVNSTPPQTKTATLGNVTFNITSGTYPVTVTHPLYATNVSNIVFTGHTNSTFDLVTGNSLLLYIYDEQTDLLISGKNITIQVINYNNNSYQTSTLTGTSFVSGFSAGDYELNVKTDGYQYRSYYTTILNATTQTLNVYLLNNTQPNNAIKNIIVLDESGNGVVGAIVSMKRFYVSCNCFRTVEMAKTSDGGKTFTFAQLYDATYQFQVDYNNEVKKVTPQIKLSTSDLLINIKLLTDSLAGYFELTNGVDTVIGFNATTGMWTYSWASTSVGGGKFVLKQTGLYSTSTIIDQNVSGASGTIVYNASAYINATGTFTGQGLVVGNSGQTYPANIYSYNYKDQTSGAAWGLMGVLLSLIIIISFALMGAYFGNGNPSIAVFSTLIGLEIAVFSTLLVVSWVVNFGIVISAIVVMVAMRT